MPRHSNPSQKSGITEVREMRAKVDANKALAEGRFQQALAAQAMAKIAAAVKPKADCTACGGKGTLVCLSVTTSDGTPCLMRCPDCAR